MSIKNRTLLCVVLCGLIAFASCTKKLDTNIHDPNGTPSDQLTGKDFFAGSLVEAIFSKSGINLYNATDNYDYANQWMGYFSRDYGWASSGGQQTMEDFQLTNNFSNGVWGSLYHNIYDFNFIIANSSKGSILPGASRVLRAMLYQELVDQYGNIPYSQAEAPLVTLQPAYDSATAIYKDLIPQLDTALTDITASQSTADDASDVLFKGDKNLWLQFANTIKLRILMRQVPNGDQAYVSTEIANIVKQGSGFLTVDALVQPGFVNLPTKTNPFWAAYGPGSQNNNSFSANTVMLNFLDSINDPRLLYYYAPNGAGLIVGEQFGNNTYYNAGSASSYGPGLLKSAAQPGLLFSAAQSFFMQAEFVQRGLLNGSAAALYKQGVEASFSFLGFPNAVDSADAYMSGSTNGMVNFSVSTNPLQTIMYQKWIAECCLDGLEAYSDYRRTGFPYVAVPSYGAPGLAIPQRLLYPETEYTQNPTNVNAENQTPADVYTPIFWAQ
jgi:Starch-binding associating with outer membrane